MDWTAIAAWLQQAARIVWDVVSSGPAQRGYVLALGAAILVAALARARRRKTELENISVAYFAVSHPGRKPTRIESVLRRMNEDRAIQLGRARSAGFAFAELLFLGVVLPCLFLLLGTVYYQWFDASADPLVDAASGVPVHHPGTVQLAAYVLDHLLRGGLFDLMEVFKIKTTSVSNNANAYPYSIGVFLFRLYIEAFFLFGLISIGRVSLIIAQVLRDAARRVQDIDLA